MDDLKITREITIPADELHWTFSPSGGPGGQHANRSSTRTVLQFDAGRSRAFDDATRRRVLAGLAGGPVVTIVVHETRSQWQNRKIARNRLADRIREALAPPPPPRRKTKPTRASKRRRIDAKRARSRTKALRRKPAPGDG